MARQLPLLRFFPRSRGKCQRATRDDEGARRAKDLSPARPGEPVFVFREGRQPRDKSLSLVKRASPRRQTQRPRRKCLLRQDRVWVQRRTPLAFRPSWPLAERYEALLRAFNDPAPYARRLSRRLHATPHRTRELLRAPPEAEARIDKFDALTQAAETAHARIDSS